MEDFRRAQFLADFVLVSLTVTEWASKSTLCEWELPEARPSYFSVLQGWMCFEWAVIVFQAYLIRTFEFLAQSLASNRIEPWLLTQSDGLQALLLLGFLFITRQLYGANEGNLPLGDPRLRGYGVSADLLG